MLLLAILACGGATVDNVRVLDLPQFICPTSTPRPTHTQPPTQVQPSIYVPPSGYATYTPAPGSLPEPGGVYRTPGYTLPGATSTPRPTLTPYPSPTPYIIRGGFHPGADVYVGGFQSTVHLRLRLNDVQIYPVSNTRQVVSWTVEIENIGTIPYAALPGAQVFIAEIMTAQKHISGQWWASREAARAAEIALSAESLDALDIQPSETYTLTLTAFTPIGDPTQFGWALDPLSGGRDEHLIGGNVAYWFTDAVPNCTGNVAPNATLAPPVFPPTATPTHTPDYPVWCTWCGQ